VLRCRHTEVFAGSREISSMKFWSCVLWTTLAARSQWKSKPHSIAVTTPECLQATNSAAADPRSHKSGDRL